MDYSKIRLRYYKAQRMMHEALLHVMNNLPDGYGNAIDFEEMLFLPVVYMEDQCSGDRSRVTVTKLELVDGELFYEGHFTDFDDHVLVEDETIDCYDGETCKEILDALPSDLLEAIKPFHTEIEI